MMKDAMNKITGSTTWPFWRCLSCCTCRSPSLQSPQSKEPRNHILSFTNRWREEEFPDRYWSLLPRTFSPPGLTDLTDALMPPRASFSSSLALQSPVPIIHSISKRLWFSLLSHARNIAQPSESFFVKLSTLIVTCRPGRTEDTTSKTSSCLVGWKWSREISLNDSTFAPRVRRGDEHVWETQEPLKREHFCPSLLAS